MFPFGEAMSNTESVLVTCNSLIVMSSRSGVMILPIDAVAVDSTIGRLGESLVLRVRVLLLMVDVEDMTAAVLSLFRAVCQIYVYLATGSASLADWRYECLGDEGEGVGLPMASAVGVVVGTTQRGIPSVNGSVDCTQMSVAILFTACPSVWRRRRNGRWWWWKKGNLVQGNSVGGLDMPRVVPLARWFCAELVSPQWMWLKEGREV